MDVLILSTLLAIAAMIYLVGSRTIATLENIKNAIIQTNITLESLAPMQQQTIKHHEKVINKLRAINGSFNNVFNKELTERMAHLAEELRQYRGWDERSQKFVLREIDDEY